MENAQLIAVLASIILQASPLIIAVCGEILTERSGVVNLSLDGTMLMAAMTAFVVGLKTDNIWLGFAAAAVIGAIFAAIVALGSIRLGQSQVAVGFVLALLGDDLSAFLGQNYTRMRGVSVPHYGIPVLKDIPVVGPILFDHDVVVYFAMALIVVTWWWLNRTQPGLKLRGSGERPTAAFARGVDVNRLRYLYTILGGALVGIAGAAFSLDVKIGWSDGHIRGTGWIALAIVIFGGWSPIRGAFGALLFGNLLGRAQDRLLLIGRQAIEKVVVDGKAAIEKDVAGLGTVIGDLEDLVGHRDLGCALHGINQPGL